MSNRFRAMITTVQMTAAIEVMRTFVRFPINTPFLVNMMRGMTANG